MLAKISLPVLPELIARERLDDKLDRSFRERATWVGGPAGSGKTALVVSYVRRRRLQCLWYRVDEGDNDPASVFQWLSAAAQHLTGNAACPDLPVFGPEKLHGLNSFARTFVRSLNEQLPLGCVLVFDDVQDVDDAAFFFALMRVALRELTPDKHVVLISRTDPHRALAAFSAGRELTFVNWSDLRFTDEEARALICLLLGTDDSANAGRLQAIADGWAAGLTLLSRCDRPPVSDRDTLAWRPQMPGVVFDYFATEFLQSLDEPLQDFLLRTGFAPMLSHESAQALSGRVDAEAVLKDLHRRNWFIVRRDGAVQAYEYHQLFRQFLCEYVRGTRSPLQVAELKCATAAVLEAAGNIEASMDLFIELADWTAIERLLCRHGARLVEQARHQTLARWLRDVPLSVLKRKPWLRYWSGVAQMPTSALLAISALTESYRAFRSSGEIDAGYIAWVTAVELLTHLNAYGPELDFWLDEMDALQAAGTSPSYDELACRVAAGMYAGITYRRSWHAEGEQWRQKALDLARKLGHLDVVIRVYVLWLQPLLFRGSPDVDNTLAALEEMIETYSSGPAEIMQGKFARMGVGNFQGAFEKSIIQGIDAIAYADEQGLLIFKPVMLYMLSRSYQCTADFVNAKKAVCELAELQIILGPIADFWNAAASLTYYFMRADYINAYASATEATRLLGERPVTWAHVVLYFVRGQIHSELGQHKLASRDIELLIDLAICTKNRLQLHHCLLAKAQLSLNQGDRITALASLREALQLAACVPFCSAYVWRPSTLARLMAFALEHDIETAAAEKIVFDRKLTPPHPLKPSDRWPRRFRVQMLGEFSLNRDGVLFSHGQSSKIALLQCLIWHGGIGVGIDTLSDDLWPEKEGDKAENALQVTLLRLRALLGDKCAIAVANHALSLDPMLWWSDLSEFREVTKALATETTSLSALNSERIAALQGRLFALYRGDLLAGASDAPWVISARKKTQGLFLRTLRRLSEYWERTGEQKAAEECYCRALAVRPHL